MFPNTIQHNTPALQNRSKVGQLQNKATKFYQNHKRRLQVLFFTLVMTMPGLAASAQTVEPTLEIPVDGMIGYMNTWIGVFAPIILFIGMIPVAIGLLRYITNLFRSAFGG